MNANAFPTTRVNPADLASALGGSQVNETAAGAGVPFLKMDYETGVYVHGVDGEIVTGETICINTASIEHGWVLWCDRKPTKVMVPFNAPLPNPLEPRRDARGHLREAGEGRSFQARFLDEDSPMAFEGNSYGIRKGVDTVLAAIKLKAASGEKSYLYPIVQLNSENYEGDEGKTIYNPVFKILDWMDINGNKESDTKAIATPTPTSEADAPSAEEAPKRRRRKAS